MNEEPVTQKDLKNIGEVKEKKQGVKQASAQSATDFLWAHFVAPLEIEEDVTIEVSTTETSGRKSAEILSDTPDSNHRFSSLGSDRKSQKHSPRSGKKHSWPKDSMSIMRARSPSPIPTPPPFPSLSEITIKTIDGNYVKIGLRPHNEPINPPSRPFRPQDHLLDLKPEPLFLKESKAMFEMELEPDKDDIFKILREKFPWFHLLNYDQQENVIDAIRYRAFKRDQVIYKQNEEPNGMYFVEEGNVDIVHDRSSSDYDEIAKKDVETKTSYLLGSSGPEEFFGEVECKTRNGRFAKAIAGSDTVKVLFLPLSAYCKYLEPNEKVISGFDQHLELYKNQLLQFKITDLGEEIAVKKDEKPKEAEKKRAAEYLWSHFYEEIGATADKALTKPKVPRDVDRGAEFLDYLFKLWMENGLCDTILKVGYHKFPVHKLVLTLFCQNYPTLVLNSEDPKKITLEDVTPKALIQTLYYLYTNKIVLAKTNVQNVLNCAIKLGIASLAELCKSYVEVYFTTEDILKMSSSLQKLHSLSTDKRMQNLLSQNFGKLISNVEFDLLPPDFLLKLISSNDLKVDNEIQVLKGVIKWINADKLTRLPLSPKYVKFIRFRDISAEQILKECLPNPDIFEIQECKALLLSAISFHALNTSKTPIKSSRCEGINDVDMIIQTDIDKGIKDDTPITRKGSKPIKLSISGTSKFEDEQTNKKSTSKKSIPSSSVDTQEKPSLVQLNKAKPELKDMDSVSKKTSKYTLESDKKEKSTKSEYDRKEIPPKSTLELDKKEKPIKSTLELDKKEKPPEG
ncbi:unnamed protein product [Gordionus sp. m RMFG-2023]